MENIINLAEKKLFPDSFIRIGIRRLCQQRLNQLYATPVEERFNQQKSLYENLKKQEIAVDTQLANQQHYELPSEFFRYVLGPYRKYSSCTWQENCQNLGEAESYSLREICRRAEINDGQTILELGCGWGSLSLWLASHYPSSHITAITNSSLQKQYIQSVCEKNKITNLVVEKVDINNFISNKTFDRIVSIEMFEHLRNHSNLLNLLDNCLTPDGKMFIHIFCHKELTYLFEIKDSSDWMSKYFFTSGMMPAFTYPLYWQEKFQLENQWLINGVNYQKTAEAWLSNCDTYRSEILDILSTYYGKSDAKIWLQRWRIFFMACAELFGYAGGEEWFVGHYLFKR